MPRYARAARFDQETKRVTCTNNTRTEILDAIHRWFKPGAHATDGAMQTDGNPQGQIFWLDGIAGTGKSTVAQTIACHYDEAGELGASFFCSRDNADCSNISLIFPTIAHQLCLFRPVLREHVSEAMRKDPDLSSALASRQLEKLIVEPLEAVACDQEFLPCLVVIDALDECKDDRVVSCILSAIAAFTNRGRLLPLKFFITSRPVPVVQRGFFVTGLMNDTNILVLHNIPPEISQKDIRVYLEERLSLVAQYFGFRSWPSSDELARLVEKSSGLFIFAATAANFIEDRNASQPRRQLGIVLATAYITSSATSPHRHLDALYLAVLREAFPDIGEDHRTRLREVLGSIVLLSDLLEAESLEALLGLEEDTVRSTLLHLHSIAVVPEPGRGSVRLIHPSLHDFLVDGDRCDDANFAVNAQLQHALLAERCLRVLDTLVPDICKIGDRSLGNQEIDDLGGRIATRIPAHVQYACRHWASHLAKGRMNDEILALLLGFCARQFLNWLEVMSLLDSLGGAITALESAHAAVKVRYPGFCARSINT